LIEKAIVNFYEYIGIAYNKNTPKAKNAFGVFLVYVLECF